jgi:diguanylate cyclase (GGDEF)-like protein
VTALHDIHSAAQARLAACLAIADPESGHSAAAASVAACEAMALAGELRSLADHARAGAWLCLHLHRLGQHTQVLQQAQAVRQALAREPLASALNAERQELLRVLTISACDISCFDVALDAAHELVRLAAASADDGQSLVASFALAACFERMGDAWQSVRLLGAALQAHGGAAPARARMLALNGLSAISIGVFHRLRGAAPDAEAQEVLDQGLAAATEAHALLAQVPDPVYEVAITGNLGEVLLHQGEWDRAETLLRLALALANQRGLTAHAWRVQASLGGWWLATGHTLQALAAMHTLLAEMGSAAPPQTASRAHHVAYRACRLLKQHAQALEHFECVEQIERQRAISQLRAQSALFVTRAEAQRAQWQAEQAQQDALLHRARAEEFAATAERDPLTGLGNRRHLQRRWAEILPAVQREGWPLALALMDIDHFKRVNDEHGHAVGDRVLVTLAQLLRERTRAGDVMARYGGEEFVLLLPGMGLELATEMCERLRECVAAHVWGDISAPLQVSLSIGLVALQAGTDLPALLQRADKALYCAKHEGRNRVCVAPAAP